MTPTLERPAGVAALLLAAAAGAATATFAQEGVLVKPLTQYVIGDVFPRVVNESFADTGRLWKGAADELSRDAEARMQSIAEAERAKKADLDAAKQELKAARREKDLVRIGTLEGTVKNEELLRDIFEELTEVSEKQIEVAAAWRRAGTLIETFTAADTALDPFRARRLTRPEDGEPDQRLGPEGVDAFRTHGNAMRELGDAFSDLGSRTKALAKARVDLLNTLGKGGHLQAAAER